MPGRSSAWAAILLSGPHKLRGKPVTGLKLAKAECCARDGVPMSAPLNRRAVADVPLQGEPIAWRDLANVANDIAAPERIKNVRSELARGSFRFHGIDSFHGPHYRGLARRHSNRSNRERLGRFGLQRLFASRVGRDTFGHVEKLKAKRSMLGF